MLNKILRRINDQMQKFGYSLTQYQIDELVELYMMNHAVYDEATLALFIENYVQKNGTNVQPADWMSERRASVYASPVNVASLEIPAIEKNIEQASFLNQAVGTGLPFSLLSTEQRNLLVASMFPIEIQAGTVLIRQGDIGHEMYIIETGEFEVSIDGKPVNHMLPGTKFGEIALLHGIPRTASVTAITDGRVWAAEQKSFSAIRIRDDLCKKAIVSRALKSHSRFRDNPASVEEAVSSAVFRVLVAQTEVRLKPEEILIVLKDAHIFRDKPVKVFTGDILQQDFSVTTPLECAIVDASGKC